MYTIYRESPIWSYPSTQPSFLFTAVFGIFTTVNDPPFPKTGVSGGRKNYRTTETETPELWMSFGASIGVS